MKYIILFIISSCSMVGFNGPDDKKEEVKASEKAAQDKVVVEEHKKQNLEQDKRLNSVEYSIADIKSTLEEVKSFLDENSEKIKVLEKAFSLGIIPDRTSGLELTDEHFKTVPKRTMKSKTRPVEKVKKSNDSGAYSLKLLEAHNNFQSGKYQQAISIYKEIGDTFSEKLTHNNQYYWLGLSYYHLERYDESRKNFEMYVEYNPRGNWARHSEYHIARCFKKQGLEKQSAMILNKIIQEEDNNSELKEMAQFELRKMEQSI